MRRLPLLLGFLLVLVAADRLRELARERVPSSVDAILEPPALPADVVRVIAVGFDSAAADASYLSAIQVYGDRLYQLADPEERRRRSLALARLLEYTTDLDPSFAFAYVFGAVSIPLTLPDDPFANADEAIALLRKGVRAGPPDWRIPFHLGYLLANARGDYAGAAQAMAEAGRREKAPAYLPLLATRLAAQGGALETGIALAKAMLQQAETDEQRAELEERLRLLEMERHLRAIEAAADRYREREGHFPADVAALVPTDLPEIPPEPHGGSWSFDPATGEASSSAARRLRLFDSERRAQTRAAASPEVKSP